MPCFFFSSLWFRPSDTNFLFVFKVELEVYLYFQTDSHFIKKKKVSFLDSNCEKFHLQKSQGVPIMASGLRTKHSFCEDAGRGHRCGLDVAVA